MQAAMTTTTRFASLAAYRAPVAARRTSLRAARLTVRAQDVQNESPVEKEVPAAPATPAAAPAATAVASAPLLPVQEVINGRAAMLGFMVAIGSELATHQSIWSQLAGKYVDQDLVEKSIGASPFFFAFAVIAITFATFAPSVFADQKPGDRAFGPFTASAEMFNGRAAMLGFVALLVTEKLMGQTALF